MDFNKKIVILEMANNHMGDVEHGKNLIKEYAKICKNYTDIEFVFKLQYRNLDTFIHPKFKNRMDLKFIKRFNETRLSEDEFLELIECMRENDFKVMVTPFDNDSLPLLKKHNVDLVKIASASFNDWVLLEDIVKLDLPIIASTAAAAVEVIDDVVSFFKHRNKNFMLMHCIGEYPTKKEHMNLNQIDFLKKRYKDIEIGLSTHEEPDNYELVKMAVSKGVRVFEKHVALPTEKYAKNAYSTSPQEFSRWLESMKEAFEICGSEKRVLNNEKELKTLRDLRRGVSAKVDLKKGEVLNEENVYFAFPPVDNQITANDWSKYTKYILKKDLKKDDFITFDDVEIIQTRKQVLDIVENIKRFIKKTNVIIPNGSELEISHHYGIENFYKYGLSMITVINREYCKKILILLPDQTHPQQYHKIKEESFFILYGEIDLYLNGELKKCKVGDLVTIEPNVKHKFFSKTGAIIEEISSTHNRSDSYYTDKKIMQNKNRKTYIKFWID